ncbi:unnamed protein product [Acanthosepion pharaonis]|uniref:Lipid-binding serum glycoprotein C-terminal domain-containing protein n=1 Tax=Acanthosepion pharaonis TaxID=158019 RepID=A0A812EQI5_ACAPH|nr:unnamed protein product [Sepia pharaonis]
MEVEEYRVHCAYSVLDQPLRVDIPTESLSLSISLYLSLSLSLSLPFAALNQRIYIRRHGLKWIISMENLRISCSWKYSKKQWWFTFSHTGTLQLTSLNSQIEITTSLSSFFFFHFRHFQAIISYENDQRIIPFTAKPLPNISENNKMVYFIISNYVLDTMLFSAHENNVFKYTVNRENLPDGSHEFFHTTCPDSFCIGTILPQFAVTFPNTTIEIYFSTFDRPRTYFYPDKIQMSIPTQLQFSTLQSNLKKTTVFNVYLNVSTLVKAQFKENKFYLSIANISFIFGQLSGPYADKFDVAKVEKGLQTMFNELTPFINSIGTTVIPLILPQQTSIFNPEFRIVNVSIIFISAC